MAKRFMLGKKIQYYLNVHGLLVLYLAAFWAFRGSFLGKNQVFKTFLFQSKSLVAIIIHFHFYFHYPSADLQKASVSAIYSVLSKCNFLGLIQNFVQHDVRRRFCDCVIRRARDCLRLFLSQINSFRSFQIVLVHSCGWICYKLI